MAERKAFLLRIDPAVLDALQAWADDELRSLNGQIEFVLRGVLQEEGRLRSRPSSANGAGTLPRAATPNEHPSHPRTVAFAHVCGSNSWRC